MKPAIDSGNIRERIVAATGTPDYTPLTVKELFRCLQPIGASWSGFRSVIGKLLREGVIVRVKQDRLCQPHDADLMVGELVFRQSGSALLISDARPGEAKPEPLPVGSEDTGVAMHKDRVLVRIVRPPRRSREHRQGRRGSRRQTQEQTKSGRVIRILKRARTTLTGTLKRSRLYHYVIPDDPRITQDILVPDPNRSSLRPRPRVNDKVVARLEEWKQRHLNPEGEIIGVLGPTHSPEAELLATLHQFNLDPEFPASVMEEVDRIPKSVTPKQIEGRLDLRGLRTFTIDPDDARDFDDALSIESLPKGSRRIGVHIADVSAYVSPRSALDREAQRRGNSTYLVGTVIPMLPQALSNGICSLVEGEDRLTKSVLITCNAQGRIRSARLANTVIRSRKRLTYTQAMALLGESDLEEIRRLPIPPAHQTGATGRLLAKLSGNELQELRKDIRDLWSIAERLRERRLAQSSLDLDMPEMKIFVNEGGFADRIVRLTHDPSHQLIEEFMLAANESVAKTLLRVSLVLIHRIHDHPDPGKLDELREKLFSFSVNSGDLNVRKNVVSLISKLKKHPQGHILRIEFLRSLKQACYRAQPDGHYGLGKRHYTHFTSPIRRYSDLVVHRIVDNFLARQGEESALSYPSALLSLSRLQSIAQHLSQTEQNSTEAERESVRLKLLEYFERESKKSHPHLHEAVVMSIRNHGMFVELTESLAYGLVSISSLRDDLYVLNSDGTQLVGRRHRRTFSVGQKVQVQVARVNRFKRQIDFRLAA